MNEIEWRPVRGWSNYVVSSHGKIRNVSRSSLVKPFVNKDGKLRVNLWQNNKTKQLFLHRIIAEAFIPNPNNYPIVRHLDDNGRNNDLDNLAWGTLKHNSDDMVRNGNHAGINKTHCKYGHEYTTANTYIDSKGGRRCRECNRLRAKNIRR